MPDSFQLKVEMPLDPDGFIRRGCPTCGREFKWWVDQDREEEEASEDPSYFCPYCRHREEDWLTAAQREYLTAKAGAAAAEQLFGSRSRTIRFEADPGIAAMEAPLDPGDMERRESSCHPEEPIKVLDGWTGPVHCLICGQAI
jgi:DNA-directed RNA polymerase subunit RPC12/RpoP